MSFLFISICLIWKKAKKQKPLIRKKESGNNNRNTVMLYACGYACVTYACGNACVTYISSLSISEGKT